MSTGRPRSRVVLVVLDGWGYRRERDGNAIELARTPVWHRLWDSAPRTLLQANGPAAGLPRGELGNSEGGHLHATAGHPPSAEARRVADPRAACGPGCAPPPDGRYAAPGRSSRPRRRARAGPAPAR